MKKIAIIGSGSWGVALAVHLAKMSHTVKIWSFLQEEADQINQKRECKFLPELKIPEGIQCSTNYEEVIKESDLILHVTPSKFTRQTVREYKKYVTNQPIIICSKGFEKESLHTLAQVIKEELPNNLIGVLSGPSHAEEVSRGIPSAIVIASETEELAKEIQEEFMNEFLRIYTSSDVKGVELGGALKNIIAFCAGVAAGIGLGDNSFAALITRGLNEITKLSVKMGAKEETLYGLTGLGDLIVTCLSEHSRNRKAGFLIGKGFHLEQVKKEVGMTIESIDNIEVAYELGKKYEIEMPIVNMVYAILFDGILPKDAVNQLMTRQKKAE